MNALTMDPHGEKLRLRRAVAWAPKVRSGKNSSRCHRDTRESLLPTAKCCPNTVEGQRSEFSKNAEQ